MSNHLASESSLYLRQHATNPVDWYPWGPEALTRARAEDKPIFLSIGYSACHWCHVMAHESFENEEIARLLNQRFVSIKVDREERPELDRIYMLAVQTLTGQGGWPMSVFLTPDGVPFYGGTYFPPEPRHGLPSFRQVLLAVADAWDNRRDQVTASAQSMREAVLRNSEPPAGGQALDGAVLRSAVSTLESQFDRHYAGWGTGPKFPQPMVLEFLLRYQHIRGEAVALQMVEQTLQAMARGGIYDQVGGGFHRYSVDGYWRTPHFEKMLYDNAQLARVYLHAWQATGDPFYRVIAEETLDYVARKMTDPAGGFYATQDADSEGHEGRFYVWSADEIRAALGERAGRFSETYAVTAQGNFEGRSILTLVGALGQRKDLENERRTLLAVRERRVHPARDEKVVTSWNGLMLAAFADAARALGRDDYQRLAEGNANFLLSALRAPSGRLYHIWQAGQARVDAFLDDYACVIEGLLSLYAATFEPRWFAAARDLAQTVIRHFAAEPGFYDTSDDHERLLIRPRELQDDAVPSGNAMTAYVLLRLADLSAESEYVEIAERSLRGVQPYVGQHPLGFGQWLIALDYALAARSQVAIVGPRDSADTAALAQVCTFGYHPHRTVAVGDPGDEIVPLLASHRPVDGKAAAYVCARQVCLPPVVDPVELQGILTQESLG